MKKRINKLVINRIKLLWFTYLCLITIPLFVAAVVFVVDFHEPIISPYIDKFIGQSYIIKNITNHEFVVRLDSLVASNDLYTHRVVANDTIDVIKEYRQVSFDGKRYLCSVYIPIKGNELYEKYGIIDFSISNNKINLTITSDESYKLFEFFILDQICDYQECYIPILINSFLYHLFFKLPQQLCVLLILSILMYPITYYEISYYKKIGIRRKMRLMLKNKQQL